MIDFELLRDAALALKWSGQERYVDANGVYHLKLSRDHYRGMQLLDMIDEWQADEAITAALSTRPHARDEKGESDA